MRFFDVGDENNLPKSEVGTTGEPEVLLSFGTVSNVTAVDFLESFPGVLGDASCSVGTPTCTGADAPVNHVDSRLDLSATLITLS